MRIQVKGYLNLKEVLGDQPIREVAEGTTVRDLLQQLALQHGDDFALLVSARGSDRNQPQMAILVNGRHATHLPAGLDTPLRDADEVAIFPPTSGG